MNNRRSFIWKLGAGVSTVVAATAGTARPEAPRADSVALRLALLEEEKVLRRLHQAFEQAMDKGLYEDAVAMFADDAEVTFNGGAFVGRNQGVSRLYRDRFAAGKTGKRMEPAPGFEPDADQQQDSVEVAPDLLSARAVFPYSIQVGMPIESDTSLASMARLHGEGVQTWWEGGVYDMSFAKNADGRWLINSLEYRTLSRADWRPGRSWARSIDVPRLSARYPEDRQGPDRLA